MGLKWVKKYKGAVARPVDKSRRYLRVVVDPPAGGEAVRDAYWALMTDPCDPSTGVSSTFPQVVEHIRSRYGRVSYANKRYE